MHDTHNLANRGSLSPFFFLLFFRAFFANFFFLPGLKVDHVLEMGFSQLPFEWR